MKKFFVIAAVLLASGIFFISKSQNVVTKPPAQTEEQFWYDYVGDDPSDPDDYRLRIPQSTPSCEFGNTMCAVKATPHPTIADRPELTDPDKAVRLQNQ